MMAQSYSPGFERSEVDSVPAAASMKSPCRISKEKAMRCSRHSAAHNSSVEHRYSARSGSVS